MRKAYDSVTVPALPSDGDFYLAYVDGSWTSGNYAEVHARFPHKRIVRITVTGNTLDAEIADIETGDLTPTSGARWAKRKIAASQHPTLYCNSSTWPDVKTALHIAGVSLSSVSFLIAAYDGKATVPAGAVGKQYLGYPGNSPGRYDVSVVADHWPGVDPDPAPPKPQPPAPQPEGDDVQRMLEDQRHTPNPVWMADGMERRWIATGAERDFWKAQGVPLIPVSAKDAPQIIDPLPIRPGTPVPK